MKSYSYELNDSEIEMLKDVGKKRGDRATRKDYKNNDHQGRRGGETDFQGASGEYIFSKLMGIENQFGNRELLNGDFVMDGCNIQVKTNKYSNGFLYDATNKTTIKNDTLMVLVTKETEHKYVIRGWLPKWIFDKKCHPDVRVNNNMIVEQKDLYLMSWMLHYIHIHY